MSKIDNPFLLYGYEGPEFFCYRKEEKEEIVSSLRNGYKITILLIFIGNLLAKRGRILYNTL